MTNVGNVVRGLGVVLIALAAEAGAGNDLLVADFDGGDYGDWEISGRAFGAAPAGGVDSHHMNGFLGNGFAASTSGAGDSSVGTLTSPPFVIEHGAIHFLLGAHEVDFLPGAEDSSTGLLIQLLVNGDVVRTTVPSKFHAMFWEAWDVTEFKGQAGRVRLVDEDHRKGAHIDVDHIVQNDVPAGGLVVEHAVQITRPILNFPVKNGGVRYYLELVVDGTLVRTVDVALATDEVDYWVVTDFSPWVGKQVHIRTRKHLAESGEILRGISAEDSILGSHDLYREPLRPQFHFSSKRGWINDPNGLIYIDGKYHLFYQHNPYDWDYGRNDYNKTWGHAVSTDLVHWTELAAAIHPDHLGSIYSGSCVLDEHNTTGFQTGEEGALIALYTSAGGRSRWAAGKPFTQSLAYSNDRGRTFTVFDGNPVQGNIEHDNRDPKAIWHEPTGKWVIVLHFHERGMAFFTSTDLQTWEFQSEVETLVLQDCPELFQLPVDGNEHNQKWILYGGSGHYFLGDFDGKKYSPESAEIQFHYGNSFYASQTFSNIPELDGRRIQMAWGTIPMPDMPFNQQMLFPLELTLRTTKEGVRLFAYPVKEIEKLHGREHAWHDVDFKPGEKILGDVVGGLYDIEAEFVVGAATSFGFLINGSSVVYDVATGELSAGGEKARLMPANGRIRLRILVDRMSIEVFANDGRLYMPVSATAEQSGGGELSVFGAGGSVRIPSLVVHELKSIWN